MKLLTSPQIITQTANGEVTINLNLTITINQDGILVAAEAKSKKPEIETPDSLFVIPEFQSEKMLNDFGIDANR